MTSLRPLIGQRACVDLLVLTILRCLTLGKLDRFVGSLDSDGGVSGELESRLGKGRHERSSDRLSPGPRLERRRCHVRHDGPALIGSRLLRCLKESVAGSHAGGIWAVEASVRVHAQRVAPRRPIGPLGGDRVGKPVTNVLSRLLGEARKSSVAVVDTRRSQSVTRVVRAIGDWRLRHLGERLALGGSRLRRRADDGWICHWHHLRAGRLSGLLEVVSHERGRGRHVADGLLHLLVDGSVAVEHRLEAARDRRSDLLVDRQLVCSNLGHQ